MATGATAIYQIPYPLPTDQVDVAGDFEQLAVKIDDNLNEWIEDIASTMITSGDYLNGINTPTYNDTTGAISMTLSQDLRSTASPTFNDLNLSGDIYLTGSVLTPSVIDVTSSTDALRITQKGTGNALLIEDSANPDSTPFVIDTNGRVISGYTSTVDTRYDTISTTPKLQVISSNDENMLLASYSFTDVPAGLYGAKSRSTDPLTRESVIDDDSLLRISAAGDDGSLFTEAARIEFQVDGVPEVDSMPGRIVFSTTIDTSNTPTERMRISSVGYVGIGKTDPETPLDVFGTITGSAGSFGNLVGTTGTVSTFNATSINSPTILTSTPTSSNQATTKEYVDNLAGSIAPEILQFDDISNYFDGQTNRFYLTNNKNGTRIFNRTNMVYDPSFEGVGAVKFKKYNVGDIGPTGGTIFITPSTAGNNTGKYFEAAPANTDGSTNIVSNIFEPYRIPGADSTIIGSGLQNTLDIIQATSYNNGEMRTISVPYGGTEGITVTVVDGEGFYWSKPSGFTQAEADMFNSMNGKSVNGRYLESYSRTNLIPNPSFEVDMSSYNNIANVDAVISSDWSKFGSYSMKSTPTSPSDTDSFIAINYTASDLGIIGGRRYRFSAYCYVPTAQTGTLDGRARQIIFYYQRASTGAAYFTFDSTKAASTGESRVSGEGIIPLDITNVLFRLYNGATNSATNAVYWDAVMLEEVQSGSDAYFDSTIADPSLGYSNLKLNTGPRFNTSTISGPGLVLESTDFQYKTQSNVFTFTPIITARPFDGIHSETYAAPVLAGEVIIFTSNSTSDFTPTIAPNAQNILPSAIFSWQGTSAADINAANLARAYSLNGYSDWYLPSKDELSQLYSVTSFTRSIYPGISYWSTSTFDDNLSWMQAYNFGYPYEEYRTHNHFVRPVRSFFADSVNSSTSHSIEKIGERWSTNQTPISNNGSVITRTYDVEYIGNSSMKVVTDGLLSYQGVSYDLGSMPSNTVYTISAYIKVSSGRPVNLVAKDLYNDITVSSIATSSSDWTRINVTITTGSQNTNIVFALITDITLGATEFYVDAVMCEQTDQLLDYFDGNNKPASAGRIITNQRWTGDTNNSPSNIKYYESGEFKPTNPQRVQMSIYGIIQTVSYPEYVWQSMIPQDGFMVDSDGYVTLSEAPTRGSTFNAKYIAGNNAVAETNKRRYPFRPIDILLGS